VISIWGHTIILNSLVNQVLSVSDFKMFKCIGWKFLRCRRIVEVWLSHEIALDAALGWFKLIFVNNLGCLMAYLLESKLIDWCLFLVDVLRYFYLVLVILFTLFNFKYWLLIFNLNYALVILILYFLFEDLEMILLFYFNLL